MTTLHIKKPLAALLASLVAGLFANQAAAAGFQLLEQNASGLGNAYAGSGVAADNASIIFYNPAGMTQLPGRAFSIGLTPIRSSFKFTNHNSVVGMLSSTGNGGDGGGWGLLPNAYLALALNQNWRFGLGLSAPFGSKTEYDKPWIGAAQTNMFDIKTYNLNPALAWRVNDRLALGFGLNWQRMMADFSRQMMVNNQVGADTEVKLRLKGDAWGWNVGALFNVSAATTIGLSYRSAILHQLGGDVRASGPMPSINAMYSSGAAAQIKLPDTLIVSASWQLSDKWQLLGDLSRTGWSSIQKVDVMRTSGQLSGLIAQRLNVDFKDSWRAALGLNYQYQPDLLLKLGLAWDQSPIKSANTRMVALPSNNRLWLSGGARWRLNQGAALDAGVAYLHLRDSSIHKDRSDSHMGLVSGNYVSSVWVLGLQYSQAF